MTISFQHAGPENLQELLAMIREMQQDNPWSHPFDQTEAAAVTRVLLENPALGRAWIIAADGQSIGYMVMAFDYSLEYGGRGAWVDEFFVRRTHRSQGIGTQALDFFTLQAKELGAVIVYLEVNHGNPAAGLYRRMGFADHPRHLMSKRIARQPPTAER